MWPFRRRPTPFKRNLDDPILHLSKSDPITIRDAVDGVLVTGATGSGKSSGPGRAFAEAYLKAGFGGLVMTQKPEELETWKRYCKRTKRSRDLVIFQPGECFDFLDHELHRPSGGGITENLVDLLSIACEISDRGGSRTSSGREEGAFWENARKQLSRALIDVITCAFGDVTVSDLYQFLATAPRTPEQVESEAEKATSFCYQCFTLADENCPPERRRDLELASTYFLSEFTNLGDKSQANIAVTLTSMLDVLNHDIAREMLSGTSTIGPEMLEDGRVIVLAVPVSEYGVTGRLIQGIIRYCFERSMLRRNVKRSPRPVFFWADEAQVFVNSHDVSFVAMCRSARVANVYLTQNLPGFRAGLGGGQRAHSEMSAILGNLNLKILTSNACPETNAWASSLIGRSRKFLTSSSSGHSASALNRFAMWEPGQVTATVSEHMDWELEPRQFATLRRGGRHRQVDAIVYQGGREFKANGKTWMCATFRQSF